MSLKLSCPQFGTRHDLNIKDNTKLQLNAVCPKIHLSWKGLKLQSSMNFSWEKQTIVKNPYPSSIYNP